MSNRALQISVKFETKPFTHVENLIMKTIIGFMGTCLLTMVILFIAMIISVF